MADTKISALPTDVGTLADGDKFPIADVSNPGVNTFATALEINAYAQTKALASAQITALPAASALADTNTFPVDQAGTIGEATGAQLATLIQKSTAGVGTSPTASQTDTITHGLGRVPTIIRIYGYGTFTSNNSATATTSSMGIHNSSGNFCVYQRYGAAITTTQAGLSSNTFTILLATGGGNYISGVIQNVTSTQFDIVWTETGTATAQVYMWEAQ